MTIKHKWIGLSTTQGSYRVWRMLDFNDYVFEGLKYAYIFNIALENAFFPLESPLSLKER